MKALLSRRRRSWKLLLVLLPQTASIAVGCTVSPAEPNPATETPVVDTEEEVADERPYPRPGGCIEQSLIRGAFPSDCPLAAIGGAGGMGGSVVVR